MKSLYFFGCCIALFFSACKGSTEKEIILSDAEKQNIQDVRKFIGANWQNTIRTHTQDSASLIGLPYPYTVPSISGAFQEMYYWDTYFTNVGLIVDGRVEQAKHNCDNMLYLVDRFGFMPNGNRTWFLQRSQPPYLSMMIRDVYTVTQDTAWLRIILPSLEKEYAFWMKNRITAIGLNKFGNESPDSINEGTYWGLGKRLGPKFDTTIERTKEKRTTIGSHYTSEFEAGWDFSPRYEGRCNDYCPLDLNANLYMYERNFAYFYAQLKDTQFEKWNKAAMTRKALMNKYMINEEDDLFYDYDYVNKKLSPIYSAAVFNVLWSEMASTCQAKTIAKSLPRLEFPYGIAACEPGPRQYAYQWDYPNGWACIQYLAVKGLSNYCYEDDAKRIGMKYLKTVSSNYVTTKNLWEKYNIIDGTINVHNEYEMPTMMGWTAGIFVYLDDYLMK